VTARSARRRHGAKTAEEGVVQLGVGLVPTAGRRRDRANGPVAQTCELFLAGGAAFDVGFDAVALGTAEPFGQQPFEHAG
jgi:hypothetical protein